MLSLVACDSDDGGERRKKKTTEESEGISSETEATATSALEDEVTPYILDENDLLEHLRDHMNIWYTGIIKGATLIDLDFDGSPEFLVCYGELKTREWGDNEKYIEATHTKVFKISQRDGLKEIYELPSNFKKPHVYSLG